MPAIPVLRTPRLLLREWRDADRAPFAAMNADPEVMEHFPRPMAREESDALLDRIVTQWEEDGNGLWAVERVSDGRFLGFAGLATPHFEAPFMPAVEVGWRLARDAWGYGYATEAAGAALAWGFGTRGLDEIVSFTVPQNRRSRAVMERLGMMLDADGAFDHPRFLDDDRMRRHVLYRLRADEWRARLGEVRAVE